MTRTEEAEGTLTVDAWVDVMCPFCFFATTSLQAALARFAHSSGVRVAYHSFQLLPDMPADRPVSLHQHLRDQHGVSAAEADAMSAQVARRGADLGLTLRPDRTRVTNTRAAHRLLVHAAVNGAQSAMLQRLFHGYFEDGLDVGDVEQLVAMAVEVGLEAETTREVLTSGAYDDEVSRDIERARELGVTGVPFLVLGGRFALTGAQSSDVLADALEQAWSACVEAPAGDRVVG